jgi:hypothetical protein
MKKFHLFFLILSLLANSIVKAQISYGGQPLSYNVLLQKKISVFELPSYDYKSMMKEDLEGGRAKPYRYGKVHDVEINPDNSGTWQMLGDGRKIWQLMLSSENAYSLSIICNKYKLNEGAKLFIFSADRSQLIGSFTAKNNLANGAFSTVPIAGSAIILEIDLEAGAEYGVFELSGVVHDYKNVLKGFGTSGSCNVNINCAAGANWQDEKRAVVRFSASGNLCTGSLINNTAQDGKPYLLTANHCVSTANGAAGAVFWFNYESTDCASTTNPSHQTINSANLVATGGNLDFTLLELSSEPPSNYKVYYAGWNRGTTPATNTTCIHHPDGDIKKISIDNDAPIINDYGSGYVTNSHWNILAWDKGTTEGGSSGSPLFDQNHRIVGDLTGGQASCDYDFDDYFARFDLSWDYNSSSSKQLKAWLDPLGVGVSYLDGYDPNTVSVGLDAKINSISVPSGSFCGTSAIKPQVVVKNNGSDEITSLTLNYSVNGGDIISEQWEGSLQASETMVYNFGSKQLPFGNSSIKAYISKPNGGTDFKSSNDTLVSSYYSYSNILSHQINGDSLVCSESTISSFSSSIEGTYNWTATGGSILSGQGTNEVSVSWDKWGARKIDLNVSNLCNSVDAPSLDIKVVELGVKLSFKTGSNASSINWEILDCEGNIIYEGNNLPSDSVFERSVILAQGCYILTIDAGNSSISGLNVSEFCGENTLVSSTSITGTYSRKFTIGDSGIEPEFNIYPNPCLDKIYVEALYDELYQDASFTIVNLEGSEVVPLQNLTMRLEVDVSNLPRGIYIVKTKTSKGEFVRKFVKL